MLEYNAGLIPTGKRAAHPMAVYPMMYDMSGAARGMRIFKLQYEALVR
jgi:hypothetical protein